MLLSICIVGCDRGKPDSRLMLADSLIEPRPDSAYTILETIAPDELSGKGNRALYALLLTQAEYKLFDSVATDSLIDVAVDYYQSGRDAEKRTRAYLYKSAEQLSSGDQVSALEWLKRAESVADTSDYALLGRIKLLSMSWLNPMDFSDKPFFGHTWGVSLQFGKNQQLGNHCVSCIHL